METQYASWQRAIGRIWSDTAPDWQAAARLMAEIAQASHDDELRHAAMQALPILRNAGVGRANRVTAEMARRRLGMVRNALHTLNAPRFGRRGVAKVLTPEEHCRRMLGLPLHGRLAPAEIHQAFKQAAKTLHPDAGGDERAFRELTEAREALMHPNKRGG
jgi:DnaJ domain